MDSLFAKCNVVNLVFECFDHLPGAHAGAPHVITQNQITSQPAPTTQPNSPAPPWRQCGTTKLTFASRTPRMLGRPPRPTCPTCRRAACHRLRSTFDARTRHHQTIRTTPMHAPIWLQQGCATSAMPPAVWRCAACRSRCVHLPCPPTTPVPLERCVPPLVS